MRATFSQLFYNNVVDTEVPYTIVSFGHNGMRADGVEYWGRPIFEAAKINAFGFVAKFPHWFPRCDFDQYRLARELIKERSRGLKIGYGYSMGGYAAVKHAAVLGLDIVIAYAPLWSISPSDLGSVRCPWTGDYDEKLHFNMSISEEDIRGLQVYLFYDPMDSAEAFHASRISEISRPEFFHPIKVRFAGHDVISVMAGKSNLLRAMESVTQGAIIAERILNNIARHGKRKSIYYYFNLAELLWHQRRYGSFSRVVQAALREVGNSHRNARLIEGKLAAVENDVIRHMDVMSALERDFPDDVQVLVWFAEGLVVLGDLPFALSKYKEARALQPTATWLDDVIARLEEIAANSTL